MKNINFSIDSEIRAKYPQTCPGWLVYSVHVTAKNPALWDYYEKNVRQTLQEQLAHTDLAKMPQIGESRAAYKKFGADPGRQRISSEALYRRIRQGKELYQINSLVDVNNLVSLETGFSLGSYDLAKIGSDILLRLAQPGESYAGIGKAAIHLENMPVLADADGAFGSPTSDSTRAMITTDTTEAMTIIYGFSGKDSVSAALQRAAEQLQQFAAITNLAMVNDDMTAAMEQYHEFSEKEKFCNR